MLTYSTSSADPAGHINKSGGEVIPGILPEVATIRPLKRVSPSRFTALRECALREVWSATRQPALLPAAPAARLGGVAHKLLEEAGRGQLREASVPSAETRWAELVNQVEEQMQQSWLERSLIPLTRTVREYEVRKIRTCNKAAKIAQETPAYRHKVEGRREIGFEVWVESPDGLIAGSIDNVQETDHGAVLLDYKSGYIMDRQGVGETLAIKDEYQVQLKLYAALYQSTFGRWPTRLEIVPLQGTNHILPFQPIECTKLLEDAVASLKQINRMISETALSTNQSSEQRLALPSPSTCRFCQWRPGCAAYQTARDNADDPQWPLDIRGTVTEIRKLGNGRMSMDVQVTSRAYETAHVRGLNPGPERHPALEFIGDGDVVGIYNLRLSASPNSFSEASQTVLYQVSKGDSPPTRGC